MEKGGSPRKPCGYKNNIALSNSDESDKPNQLSDNQKQVTSNAVNVRRKSILKAHYQSEASERRKRIKTSFNLEEIVANLGKVIEESKFSEFNESKFIVTAKFLFSL
jgi:hypothetical protein